MDRLTLRRRALGELGDLRLLTATATGTTTTLIDTVNLWGEPGHYAGRLAYVASGTVANLGQTRLVNGSSQSAMSLTFAAALPAATQAGDEVELVNTFGMGWTFEDVHHAINASIAEARDYGLVPLTEDSTDAFDQAGTREVPLPETWTHIERVQYLDPSTDHVVNIRRANVHGANGWAVDHANRSVLISGEQAYRADTAVIRLHGYGQPEPLETDSDETSLDPEWLMLKVCSRMLLNVVRSRSAADTQGQGLYYADKADKLRARLTPLLGPSATRI